MAHTPRQSALAEWAVDRYREAGLELPPLEIEFHPDPSGCRDNSGYYLDLRVDLCVDGTADVYARGVVAHELGHAWIEANLSADVRDAFLELRGLERWTSSSGPWSSRGYEQAAEILAWGVGGIDAPPLLPDGDDGRALAVAFELLTGRHPLARNLTPA